MDTAMMNYSSSDYNKHRMGNPNRSFYTNRTLYSHPSDNLLLASFLVNKNLDGGNFMSLPPPNVFRSPHNFMHRGQQPPLLPLPISMPRNNHSMSMNNNIARSNSTTSNNNIRLSSSTRINKNVKNRGRDHSVTPKKSKTQKKDQKKLDEQPDKVNLKLIVGPDPKDLPKVDVITRRVFSSSIVNNNFNIDKFSGSVVFTPSPPPSSLPLPTFSLRPKKSCAAQAAGIDTGATDSLRRLLHLP